MANADRLMGTGMPASQAKEVATQIDSGGAAPTWASITGKPSTFPPTIGTTATTALAGNTELLQIGTTATTAKAGDYQPTWAQVTGKPTTFPATVPVATATALATTRAITLTGDVTGTANFDGSAPASITAAIGAGVIVNADVAAAAAIALTKLANVAAITTAGGTAIPAGTLQTVLQAIADLADPAP